MTARAPKEASRIRDVYRIYDQAGRQAVWARDGGILHERGVRLRTLLRAVSEVPTPRVLDLGCGRGELRDDVIEALGDETELVGMDLLPDRVAEALTRGVPVVLGDGAALPFPDSSFDLVLAFTVLSSIGSNDVLGGVADEVARVLRPAGSLVVYDMRVPNPWNRNVRPLSRHRLRQIFDDWEQTGRSCTLLPPLARRAANQPGRRYDLLAAVPALRSHRLTALQPPQRGLGLDPLPRRPRVSVIMPVRNEERYIQRSLGAVLDQHDVPDLEVIVVDGASDDRTVERVRSLAAQRSTPVEVVTNPHRIVPISMNLGLQKATGDVIVRVDGHCIIEPDYIQHALEALRQTGVECVGGPMRTVGETRVAHAISVAQSSRFGVGGVAFRTSSEAAFVDTVAFGAYRSEVFDRVGTFDEELVRNQDDELNLRLTRAGGRIWMDPRIRSTYFSRGTFGGLWRQYHGYGRYKVRVMRKHRTVPSVRHVVPAAFVGGLGAAMATSLARKTPFPVLGIVIPYLAALEMSSTVAAEERSQRPLVARAMATMHVAYGVGTWRGLIEEFRPWRSAGHGVDVADDGAELAVGTDR